MISPMRPGITLPRLDQYSGAVPAGWIWEPKLDDERAILLNGALHNRFGRPLAPHKARAFAPAIETLPFEQELDLALLGFRGNLPLGAVVLLDAPGKMGYLDRKSPFVHLPVLNFPMKAVPGTVYRLPHSTDARALFESTINVPGLEGIIGRRPGAPYVEGTSRDMAKSRWRAA